MELSAKFNSNNLLFRPSKITNVLSRRMRLSILEFISGRGLNNCGSVISTTLLIFFL